MEVRLDKRAPGGALSLAQIWISGQSADGRQPFCRSADEEAVVAILDKLGLYADRIGDHGQTGDHVLQNLQSAFALAPQIVWKPADADIRLGQFLPFGLLRPNT